MKFTSSLVAVAAGAALALAPAAAFAGTETHHDKAGDVLAAAEDRGNQIFGIHREPRRIESDISWIRTTHAAHAVRIKVQFRELRRIGSKDFRFAVRGANGKTVVGDVFADDIGWKGRLDEDVDPRVTFAIDYTANTFTLTVPRIVLAQPLWVQSAFRMNTMTLSPDDENAHYHQDDARRGYNGVYKRGPAGLYGPRVFQ